MKQINESRLKDRQQAGQRLAEKLALWSHCDGVVLAVSDKGSDVAKVISDDLGLPLELTYCATIEDPSIPGKTLGSVCVREAVIHDSPYDLPQEYLAHQVRMLQSQLRFDQGLSADWQTSLQNKVVIVVDDSVNSADEMLATIEYVRRQEPLEIVAAIGAIRADAVPALARVVDELYYLESCVSCVDAQSLYAGSSANREENETQSIAF